MQLRLGWFGLWFGENSVRLRTTEGDVLGSVARQNFIRAKMVDSVVSPFPHATFHVSTS